MDYQLEMGWGRLRESLSRAHNGRDGPMGQEFLPPEEVVDRFLRVYPKFEDCRAAMMKRLTAPDAHLMENGKVRVPFGSCLLDTASASK
jgi:hypothetical protein